MIHPEDCRAEIVAAFGRTAPEFQVAVLAVPPIDERPAFRWTCCHGEVLHVINRE